MPVTHMVTFYGADINASSGGQGRVMELGKMVPSPNACAVCLLLIHDVASTPQSACFSRSLPNSHSLFLWHLPVTCQPFNESPRWSNKMDCLHPKALENCAPW